MKCFNLLGCGRFEYTVDLYPYPNPIIYICHSIIYSNIFQHHIRIPRQKECCVPGIS